MFNVNDSRRFLVAEIQHEGTDGGKRTDMEVSMEGVDGLVAAGPVSLLPLSR